MQLLPSPDGAQAMAQAMAQARLGSFAAGWPASAGPRPAIVRSSWSLANCRPPAQLLVARTRRTAGDVPPRPNCAASAPAGPDWGSLRDCAPRGRRPGRASPRGHRAPSATLPAGWGADSDSHRLPASIVQGGDPGDAHAGLDAVRSSQAAYSSRAAGPGIASQAPRGRCRARGDLWPGPTPRQRRRRLRTAARIAPAVAAG